MLAFPFEPLSATGSWQGNTQNLSAGGEMPAPAEVSERRTLLRFKLTPPPPEFDLPSVRQRRIEQTGDLSLVRSPKHASNATQRADSTPTETRHRNSPDTSAIVSSWTCSMCGA